MDEEYEEEMKDSSPWNDDEMTTMISQENMWMVDSPPTPNPIHAGYVY